MALIFLEIDTRYSHSKIINTERDQDIYLLNT